jgi:hypothetical protein
MNRIGLFVLILVFPLLVLAQARQSVQSVGEQFDFSEYGVRIQPEQRLIIMMAALEAAGFDAKVDSPFRQELRRDLANLDPNLRRRMRDFFVRANKNLENATPTDQAARYVTLAYALTPAPDLSEPARSADLPAGLLEVLDFAPLVREFYRASGIAAKIPDYVRKYQAVGDLMRPNVARAVSDTAGYLNTRPIVVYTQRVVVNNKDTTARKNKSPNLQTTELRERQRNFYVVPDLLAVPNSVKFRVLGDDYFAIVGADVKAENSIEFRRAYLQFLIDPIVDKNAKEIYARRDAVKDLLTDAAKTNSNLSSDVFLAVSRSFVVAAEAMQARAREIEIATLLARREIDTKKNEPEKLAVSAKLKEKIAKIENDTFASLAEGYDEGAVLAFYFADQLRGLESAGFDVTASFTDMIASLDVGKEKARLTQNANARKEAVAASKKRRVNELQKAFSDEESARIRNDELIKSLNDVEQLLQTNDFEQAEKRLNEIKEKYPGELRVYYALGRTASLAAKQAFDETARDELLKKAVANYIAVLNSANANIAPKALLSNTHVALGKIYEFYIDEQADYKAAALREFEAAIALGDIKDGAYREAVTRKQRLTTQK